MAIKKSELYSSLWASCDELRGGMDPSQYKDYVLVLLFVKYVSDKYANDPDAIIEIPEGGSFKDMIALKHQKDIGDKINTIIGELAKANDLVGVIDVADFNDDEKLGKGKEMVLRGHDAAVTSAAFSPDGSHVVTASRDGTARYWRVTGPALLEHLKRATNACLSPEQRQHFMNEEAIVADARAAACEQRIEDSQKR